jgi:hypothetical protein
MKTLRLIALLTLPAFVATVSAQEYWDDVYFPSGKSHVSTAERVTAVSEDIGGRDVDEYNRRYEAAAPSSEEETAAENERRSDTEYSERIIRYHSPEKVTITGADQVNLYLSDGYYSYDYETDYTGGQAQVNVYYGGYDPWYYYNPWGWYSWRPSLYYGGWAWGGFYGWHDPWYYYPRYYYGGYYGGHYGHYHGGGHHSDRPTNTWYSNGRKSNSRDYASGRGNSRSTYGGRNANAGGDLRSSNSRERSRRSSDSSPAVTTRSTTVPTTTSPATTSGRSRSSSSSSPSFSSPSFSSGRSSGSGFGEGGRSSGSSSSGSGGGGRSSGGGRR